MVTQYSRTTILQVASVWQGLWINRSTLITMAIRSGPVLRKCLQYAILPYLDKRKQVANHTNLSYSFLIEFSIVYFQTYSQTKFWAEPLILLKLTLKGPGGGGAESAPPSTFRAIISWNFFFAPWAFMTFFFQVLRNFWCYFRKNRAYGSKVTQHYVIDRRLKIWEFSGFVYKTYGKWLLVSKLHFEL